MDKLTIFWGEQSAKSFYWHLAGNNDSTEKNFLSNTKLESKEILKADLVCMSELVQQKKVELVLSANDIHFNQVELPGKAQRHLRKAVPYLIEENLAEPVDQIFIAVGERTKQGKIPVRGIKLAYLQRLIEQFEQAEITLDSIKVDLDILECPEVGFYVVLLNEDALIVDETDHRWCSNQINFTWLAQRFLAEQKSDEELPIATPLKIFCSSQDSYTAFESQLPVGLFAPQVEIIDDVHAFLATSTHNHFNLLQGEFEPKVESSPLKSMLTKVASIVGIVFAAHLLYQSTQWFWLSAQNDNLYKQRTVLWKQAFPGRKVPSNPDKILKSFLKTLGNGQGEDSFLSMLISSAEMMKDLNQVYPTNISYNAARNELRMDLIAKDLSVLNKYRDDLKVAGHQVDMSSATQRGDGYSSRLIVRSQ